MRLLKLSLILLWNMIVIIIYYQVMEINQLSNLVLESF